MLLLLFATLCVTLTAGRVVDGEFLLVNEGEELPLWPNKYTVKATKITLTANLVEDFVVWRTNQSSRIDSNHGVVKSIVKIDPNDEDNGEVTYEIHPVTDQDENIEIICSSSGGASAAMTWGLDTILPDVEYSDYKAIRNETVLDREAVRFEYVDKNDDEDDFYILWAVEDYDIDEELVLIPIRYEVREYNSKLGSLTKHEIWDFYDFKFDFDEDDVFDVEQFECDEDKLVKVSPDSDAVTKELMFVNPENKFHVNHVFNSFMNKFNRKYAHEEEHNLRRSIFKQNMRLISSTNRQHLGYKLAINQFADRTPQELKMRTGLLRRPEGKSGNKPFPYTEEKLKDIVDKLPKEVDLRLDGLVSPVKNQGNCGSCWTYGTTSAVEGALARVNGGRLMSLSNQALIDCAWGFGAAGCNGGTDNAAYDWMIKYGLPTEEEYGSYENKDGYCHIYNVSTLFPIKGYTDVTPFSKEALKVALFNHGPLSVSVEVTYKFGLYSSGIFYEKDCGPVNLNHEVTLVGYGEQYGELFWILKNSWGENWGIDGYMLISAKDNDCGVATEPTYVVF